MSALYLVCRNQPGYGKEVIDNSESKLEAEHMAEEYRLESGPNWTITVERQQVCDTHGEALE